MGFGGGGSSGPSAEEIAAQQEAERKEREARIREATNRINTQFEAFDDPFFATRATAYTDFAMPQLEQQYQDARRNLIFQLGNAGLLQSSAGNQALADLERDRAEQQATILATGQDQADALRQQVNNEQRALISQAQAAESPSAVADNALNSIASLQTTPLNFSPLGTMFDSVLAGVQAGNRNRLNTEVGNILGSVRPVNELIANPTTGTDSGRPVNV